MTFSIISVSAEGASDTELLKKALLGGLRSCYSSYYMEQSVSQNAYSKDGIKALMTSSGTDALAILVPSQHVGNTLSTPKITCEELFSGVTKRGNMSSLPSITRSINSLSDIGYVETTETNNTAEYCFSFAYAHPGAGNTAKKHTANTNTICVTLDSNAEFNPSSIGADKDHPAIRYDNGTRSPADAFYLSFSPCLADGDTSPHQCLVLSNKEKPASIITAGDASKSVVAVDLGKLNVKISTETLKSAGNSLGKMIESICNRAMDDGYGGSICLENAGYTTDGDNYGFHGEAKSETQSIVYKMLHINDNNLSAATRAMRYFYNGGTVSWDDIAFTEQDEFNLYNAYLQYVLSNSGTYGVWIGTDCSSNLEDVKVDGYAIPNDTGQWCPIHGVKEVEAKFNMPASNDKELNSSFNFNMVDQNNRNRLTPKNFATVIKRLMELAARDNIDPSGSIDTTPTPDNGEGDSASDPCGEGAGALGWILCPTISMLSNTVQNIYDDYIQQNFMEVQSKWLDTSNDLYTQGWSRFRNYANIIFAILLLIVILSQVTGIGITNYGIKKMLPRLVIVAVLINLSFFVCQLAVDISNIAGYTMKDVLTDIGASFSESPGNVGGVGWLNTLSVAGLGLGVSTIGSWLVPLLLALLTGLISVVFAGLILGLRQAGVLILVVVSPLAFACYALDGTKNIFDKWKKLFINLLIVFPACGLLMGGGIFASDLLMSINSGIFIRVIAALLQIVPFFFIPMLVKGALASLGNIGTKIGMLGRGLRGSANRAARGSDLYQRADAGAGALQGKSMLGLRRGIGSLVRKVPGGDKLADSKFGKFMGRRGNRQIARYAQKEYDLATKTAAANAIAEGGFLDADRRKGIEASAIEKAESQGIEEQQSLFRTQLGTVGVSSETTLSNELRKIQNEFNQNPQDATLRRKVKALTKFMLDFDDGRGALAKAFHETMSNRPNSATAQAMNDFLQRGENMGVVKQSGQRGLQAMLQDVAQGTIDGQLPQLTKSLHQYAIAKADKPNPATIGKMDTSALVAQVEAIASGDFSQNDFKDWAKVYQQTMDNQHTASNLSEEQIKYMQQIRDFADHGVVPPLPVPH